MIRNIRFSDSFFKFGCGNRVDGNMMYSCCSHLSNSCRFVYDWHHAMAKHDINDFFYFVILLEIRFILKLPASITSFFKTLSADSFLFKCFSSFPSPFGGLHAKLRIMVFHLLFLDREIQWHQNFLGNVVFLQQNDSFTKRHTPSLRYCLY